ncbi:hypothetical protein HYV64_00415 [Candidatus Shapirobacteria bacterium]|nr:hypothetical protein [Candidatus Shapirobacteria bacterium]
MANKNTQGSIELVLPKDTVEAIKAYAEFVQPRITFEQAVSHFISVGMDVELLVRSTPGITLDTRYAKKVSATKKGKK